MVPSIVLYLSVIPAFVAASCSQDFQLLGIHTTGLQSIANLQSVTSKVQCALRCSRHPDCTVPKWVESHRLCQLYKDMEDVTQPQKIYTRKLLPAQVPQKELLTENHLCSRRCYDKSKVPQYYLGCPTGEFRWRLYDKATHSFPYSKMVPSFSDTIQALTMCYWMQEDGKSDIDASAVHYGVADDNLCNDFVAFIHGNATVVTVHNIQTPLIEFYVRDNQPHHICLQWKRDQGQWRLFKDGKLAREGNQLFASGNLKGNGRMYIGLNANYVSGTCNAHAQRAFVGRIAQAKVWENYLTENEINENYKFCRSNFDGLKFNMDTASVLTDRSTKVPFCTML